MVTANGGLEGDWYKHPRSTHMSLLDRRAQLINGEFSDPCSESNASLETHLDKEVTNVDGFPIDPKDKTIADIDAAIDKNEEALEEICENSLGIAPFSQNNNITNQIKSAKAIKKSGSLSHQLQKSLYGLEGKSRLTKLCKQFSVFKGVQLGLHYNTVTSSKYAKDLQAALKKNSQSGEIKYLFIEIINEFDKQKWDNSNDYGDLMTITKDALRGTFFTPSNKYAIFNIAPNTHVSYLDKESSPEIITLYLDELLHQSTIGEMARVAITTGMILRNGAYNRQKGKRDGKLMRDKLTDYADWILQCADKQRAISLEELKVYKMYPDSKSQSVGMQLHYMQELEGKKQQETYVALGRIIADTQITLSRDFPEEHYLADALHYHADILEKVFR